MPKPVRVKSYPRRAPYTRRTAQTQFAEGGFGAIRRAPSPGKFEGEMLVSQMLWEASLEWGESGIGDVQGFGYFQRHDFDEGFVEDLEKSQGKLNPAEKAFVRKQVGAIVSEDNSGFVYVKWFESKKALDKIWGEIEDEIEDYESAEEY